MTISDDSSVTAEPSHPTVADSGRHVYATYFLRISLLLYGRTIIVLAVVMASPTPDCCSMFDILWLLFLTALFFSSFRSCLA